jgi:hypothetical protein
MSQKATSLISATFVSSQIFVTLKVFEQIEILAVQCKISPLTNGARTHARTHTHTHTHTHFYVGYITSKSLVTSRKRRGHLLYNRVIYSKY